jgi:hypothetical protein
MEITYGLKRALPGLCRNFLSFFDDFVETRRSDHLALFQTKHHTQIVSLLTALSHDLSLPLLGRDTQEKSG